MVLGVPLEHEWLVPKLLLGNQLGFEALLRSKPGVPKSDSLIAKQELGV
jgi:hypothetical protein